MRVRIVDVVIRRGRRCCCCCCCWYWHWGIDWSCPFEQTVVVGWCLHKSRELECEILRGEYVVWYTEYLERRRPLSLSAFALVFVGPSRNRNRSRSSQRGRGRGGRKVMILCLCLCLCFHHQVEARHTLLVSGYKQLAEYQYSQTPRPNKTTHTEPRWEKNRFRSTRTRSRT